MQHAYLELHVPGARGLSSGQRDLLAEISGRDDFLRKRHTVVLQVDQLETITDDGVMVDGAANVVDQLDDEFGHVVAWGSLDTRIYLFIY